MAKVNMPPYDTFNNPFDPVTVQNGAYVSPHSTVTTADSDPKGITVNEALGNLKVTKDKTMELALIIHDFVCGNRNVNTMLTVDIVDLPTQIQAYNIDLCILGHILMDICESLGVEGIQNYK